jgi:hypothetical protein
LYRYAPALAFVLAAPQTAGAASRSATAVRRILCAAAAVGASADLDSSDDDDDEDDENDGSNNNVGGRRQERLDEDFDDEGVDLDEVDAANGCAVGSSRRVEKNYKAEAKTKARAI